MRRHLQLAALALTGLLAAGCRADEKLNSPDLSNNNGLLQRYVALGTSISAGFQSAGISDSTQRRAFPVLVATQAGAAFNWPRLAGRGCPAPWVNNVTQARVGNQPANTPCDLRVTPAPPYLNNIAVPGLRITDIYSTTALPDTTTFDKLETLFLGGKTPIRALMEARPTLVTVEVGANDLIGALLATDPGASDTLTPLPLFQQLYERLADSLDKTGAKVVLLTVPDVRVIPYASSGATYWCLKTGACPGVPAAGFPATFTVNNSCAPSGAIPTSSGEKVLVPWPVGIAGLLRASSPPFTPFTLDCTNDRQVVLPQEFDSLTAAHDGYNAIIQQVAAARGYAVVDADAILAAARLAGGIPPFPDLSAVPTGGSIGFGPYLSLDGFHPSSATHRVVADSVIAALNRNYGTQIPLVGP